MVLENIAGGAMRIVDGVVQEANAEAIALLGADPVGRAVDHVVGPGHEPIVWAPEVTTASEPASTLVVAPLRIEVDNPLAPRIAREPERTIRFLELVARGPMPLSGTQVVLVRRAGHQVRTARVARELGTATSVLTQVGDRLWGPVGRDISDPVSAGSALERVHPEDVAQILDLVVQLQDRGSGRAETQLRLRDLNDHGRWLEAEVRMTNLIDDPEIGGFLVSIEELSPGSDVESIGHTGGSFLSIAEAAPVGIILSGRYGAAVYFNDRSRRLLRDDDPPVGSAQWVEIADPSSHDALRRQLRLEDRASDQITDVASFPDRQGGRRWLLVTTSTRRVEGGRVIGFVTTLQDISAEVEAKRELEAAQQRLVHLATHDPLTGLPNRAFLADHIGRPGAGSELAVLFCDLDGFKAVNDENGHDAGDRVLARAAERIRTVAGGVGTVARLGGDEFVVVIDGDAADRVRLDADDLAVRLVRSMREPVSVALAAQAEGLEAAIGVSIGAAAGPAAEGLEVLVHRADDAMYRAKAAGRGRHTWAD